MSSVPCGCPGGWTVDRHVACACRSTWRGQECSCQLGRRETTRVDLLGCGILRGLARRYPVFPLYLYGAMAYGLSPASWRVTHTHSSKPMSIEPHQPVDTAVNLDTNISSDKRTLPRLNLRYHVARPRLQVSHDCVGLLASILVTRAHTHQHVWVHKSPRDYRGNEALPTTCINVSKSPDMQWKEVTKLH